MKKISNLIKYFIVIILIFGIGISSAKAFDFFNSEGKFVLTDSFKNIETFGGDHCSLTKLKNGNVLLTNGKKAELYNAKTHKFENTGSFNYPREGVSDGVLLNNGKVFFVGTDYTDPNDIETAIWIKYRIGPLHPKFKEKYDKDFESYKKTAHAELYNPDTGKFEIAAIPNNIDWRRINEYKVTLLKDGRVFLLKSLSCRPYRYEEINANNEAQIYDPATDKFITAADLHARVNEMFTQEDGRVILFPMGIGNKYFYYYPETNTYSPAKLRERKVSYDRMLRLKNGKFLLFGGEIMNKENERSYSKTIQIFDPETGIVSIAGNMLYQRGQSDFVVAIELNNGKILFSGGNSIDPHGLFYQFQDTDSYSFTYNAELFDVNTGQSKNIGYTKIHRNTDKSVMLDGGSILIVGSLPRCELFIPRYKEVK